MTWRPYEAKDGATVDTLHARMMVRTKMRFDLPALDKRPILIGMVYEKDGVVTHAAALEAQAEIMLLGETALPLKEWNKAAAELRKVCEMYRIRLVRAFVPTEALGAPVTKKLTPVERILKHFGFVRELPAKIAPFSLWLGKE